MQTFAPKAWIALGFAWLSLCVYAWGSWVLGPDFVPNTVGRELAPRWYVIAVRGVEIFAVVSTAWILYAFVIKPKIKTGSLSFDGLFFLAGWSLYIQEPWLNWISPQFLYSTVFINYGSWLNYIPGWSSPNAEKMPVALAWGLAYLWLVSFPAWAASRFMHWARIRYPQMSSARILGMGLAALAVFVISSENLLLRMGMIVWGSTIPSLTLFAGKYYQYPIYETFSWIAVYVGLASVHYFRNDKGESWPERGIDKLKLSPRWNTFARFLAIMAYCQTMMLVTYNIPFQVWALHSGPLLPVFEEYYTAGLCGPTTAYDCPRPDLPIARRSSRTNRIVTAP